MIWIIGAIGTGLGCLFMVNETYLKTGLGLFTGGTVFIKVAFDRLEEEMEQYTKEIERKHEEIQLCCVHLGCSGLQQQLHSTILPQFQMQPPPPYLFCSAVNRYMSVHYRPIQIGMTNPIVASSVASTTASRSPHCEPAENNDEDTNSHDETQAEATAVSSEEEATTTSNEIQLPSSVSNLLSTNASASTSSSSELASSTTMSPFKKLTFMKQQYNHQRSQSMRSLIPYS
jgi:hypothetical protein